MGALVNMLLLMFLSFSNVLFYFYLCIISLIAEEENPA